MAKKTEFRNLKVSECFQYTKGGPIYMKDGCFDNVCLIGKQKGRVAFPASG